MCNGTYAESNEAANRMEPVLSRALCAAHLLTGTREAAERAVIQAIGSWQVEDETGEELFERALTIAASYTNESTRQRPGTAKQWKRPLPPQMQAVVDLPAPYRAAFVLRILLRFPREVCVRILNIPRGLLDERTASALQALPELADWSKLDGMAAASAELDGRYTGELVNYAVAN